MDIGRVNYYWPRVGGVIALGIGMLSVVFLETTSSMLSMIYWLHLAVLMIHEFEEYVFPGGFKKFFNYSTVFALPEPRDNAPMTEGIIMVINLGFWIIFALAAIFAEVIPWLGVGMVIMNFSNIFGHLFLFQLRKKGYNPGLLTAILMIPFSIFVFDYVVTSGIMNTIDWLLAVISGLIAALSLPVTGARMRKRFL